MMRCTLVAMVPVAARRRKRALGGVRPTTGARVGFRESSARRSTCRRCRSRETKVAPSRRARSSGARGSRGASFARHRSCTRRKRSGRLVTSYGHSVRARVCKNFANAKRPKRESSTRFCETFLSPQPRARPHARHEDAPPTALRLSGAMGGSRNSGRRVGGGGLGSVRPRSFRAPRCRHARPPPPPPGFLESARGLSTPSPDALPPLRAFPRLVHDRVSRARLPATAPTSAATTGDSSSRATTATSRISTPTARSDQICAL